MHGIALLLTGLVLGLALPGNRGEPETPHPLHLSYGNMVLEGDFVVLKVRMFQDDLETVLSQFHNIESLRLRADPIVDSLFTSYFNTKFTLAIGDSTVYGAVVASGESDDMWWFTVLFEGWEPITEISFRNDLLFDLFDDQRNITRVLYTPTERHRTYYSVASDPETHRFSAHD